jgi:L,D-transpeptidase ErfK/SrfK
MRRFMFQGVPSLSLLLLLTAGAGADPAVHAKRVLDPQSEVVGELQTVYSRYEDTLIDIARANGLGYHAIRNANPGVDVWLPGEGTRIVLPRRHVLPRTHRSGIVINLPEMRLYDFTAGDQTLMTYAISIGRMDWNTPLGTLRVIEKTEKPTWHPPTSIRESYAARGEPLPARVPPGPDNPLGEFAMRLSNPSYLIHGTNWPEGIGLRATHGCIRLGPDDIEHLFSRIPVGTQVHIVNEPVKAGWSGETLYLEAHPFLEELQEANNLTPAVRAVVAATGSRRAQVDWHAVQQVVMARTGIPEPVGILLAEEATADAVEPPDPLSPEGQLVVQESATLWFVQVGIFGDADNAHRLAVRMEAEGFAVLLEEYERDGRALTRVLAGPESHAEDARALLEEIRRSTGEEGRVVALGAAR